MDKSSKHLFKANSLGLQQAHVTSCKLKRAAREAKRSYKFPFHSHSFSWHSTVQHTAAGTDGQIKQASFQGKQKPCISLMRFDTKICQRASSVPLIKSSIRGFCPSCQSAIQAQLFMPSCRVLTSQVFSGCTPRVSYEPLTASKARNIYKSGFSSLPINVQAFSSESPSHYHPPITTLESIVFDIQDPT